MAGLRKKLYRNEYCKEQSRWIAPCWPPGMATQARQAYCQRYSYFSIARRYIYQLSSAHSPPVEGEFYDIVMPNRCGILQLRADQCFVCSLLSLPSCLGRIAPTNPIVLLPYLKFPKYMLIPIQIICNS